MADAYKKPFFDSSVFVAGIEGEVCKRVKRGVVYQYLMDRVKAKDYKIIISAVAISEVFKKKRFTNPGQADLDVFLELIEGEDVGIVEVDREIAIHAHKLCRRFSDEKLLPMDALHLACALRAGCDVLLTWDYPFSKVKHENIRIEEPQILERDLFTEIEIATEEEQKTYDEANKKTSFVMVTTTIRRCGGEPAQGKTEVEIPKIPEAQQENRNQAGEKSEAAVVGGEKQTPGDDRPAGHENGSKPVVDAKGIEPSSAESQGAVSKKPEDNLPLSH